MLLSYLLTYLLTPWCRVLLEKLTSLQLVKKFPAFHGTRRSITALTSVRHLPLSWANPIQSIYPHPTSWRSILILSTHLRLGHPSGLFPSGFPTKTLYTPSPHPYAPHAQPISIKLFTSEQYSPLVSNYLVYYFSLTFGFSLSLLFWFLVPYLNGFISFQLGLCFFGGLFYTWCLYLLRDLRFSQRFHSLLDVSMCCSACSF